LFTFPRAKTFKMFIFLSRRDLCFTYPFILCEYIHEISRSTAGKDGSKWRVNRLVCGIKEQHCLFSYN